MPDSGKTTPQELAQVIDEAITALIRCGAVGERDFGPEVQQPDKGNPACRNDSKRGSSRLKTLERRRALPRNSSVGLYEIVLK
jgi:hypothetical protein